MIKNILPDEVRRVIPKSEEEFLARVREGDLVRVTLPDCAPQLFVYELISGDMPKNYECGFLEQDKDNPFLIRRWKSLLSKLQFDGSAAIFNHLYCGQTTFSLDTLGFGYRLDLLRRAGKLDEIRIDKAKEIIDAVYNK